MNCLKVLNNKKFEYNLSEILFEVPKNSNLDKQYEIILENIKIMDLKILQ